MANLKLPKVPIKIVELLISPQKNSKIIKHYFAGMHQANIAKKAEVGQSTVSVYASREGGEDNVC